MEILLMSGKERKRLVVLAEVKQGKLSVAGAGRRMKLVKPGKQHPWRQDGVGLGKEFWRSEKARGAAVKRAQRQAVACFRQAFATLRLAYTGDCLTGKSINQNGDILKEF